jgi:hypothetical protein
MRTAQDVSVSDPSSGPDELERLFRRLVLNVAQLDPSRLDAPLPLVEIHENLVPYRTHRAVLAIETHQDYEMVVLRLLAGERGLARVEPDEVRQLLEREAYGVNPDTGIFRRFPSATVRLEPDQVREVLGATPAAGTGAGKPEPAVAVAATPAPKANAPANPEPLAPAVTAFAFAGGEAGSGAAEDTDQPELPFSLADAERPEEIEPTGRDVTIGGAQCGYCGGDLPVGRTVIFCPHCGQNVGVMHCPVCGTELDVGWQFCITCGREMAGLG